MKVLDELSEGRYIRTMIVTADSPDSEYSSNISFDYFSAVNLLDELEGLSELSL